MLRTLGPARHAKSPALGEMLAGGADQGVDAGIADRRGDWIDAALLRRLVGMIEVELVHELIEQASEVGGL